MKKYIIAGIVWVTLLGISTISNALEIQDPNTDPNTRTPVLRAVFLWWDQWTQTCPTSTAPSCVGSTSQICFDTCWWWQIKFPLTNGNILRWNWTTKQVSVGRLLTEDFPDAPNEAIISRHFAPGAVTTAKLANNSITTNHIVDGAITSAKLAVNSILSNHITDGAVTTIKIANWAVTTIKLADWAVTNSKIADGSVTTNKFADGWVGTLDLANGSVTTPKFADEAVTSIKIADWAVTTPKIVNNAVITVKIADGGVSTADLADSSVTNPKLADNSVTSPKIVDGQVLTQDIANGAVTNPKLADNSVTSPKIVDGQVLTQDIANGAVTNPKLADNSVTSPKIVDRNVTNPKLADNSVSTEKIIDGSVTAAKLNQQPSNIRMPQAGDIARTSNVCTSTQVATSLHSLTVVNGTSVVWTMTCVDTPKPYRPDCSGILNLQVVYDTSTKKRVCKESVAQLISNPADLYWDGDVADGNVVGNIWTKTAYNNVGVGLTNPTSTLTVQDSFEVKSDWSYSYQTVFCPKTNTWVLESDWSESKCALCPANTTLNPVTYKCMTTQCDLGYTYDTTSKMCKKISCPTDYVYNPGTNKCDPNTVTPPATTGTYCEIQPWTRTASTNTWDRQLWCKLSDGLLVTNQSQLLTYCPSPLPLTSVRGIAGAVPSTEFIMCEDNTLPPPSSTNISITRYNSVKTITACYVNTFDESFRVDNSTWSPMTISYEIVDTITNGTSWPITVVTNSSNLSYTFTINAYDIYMQLCENLWNIKIKVEAGGQTYEKSFRPSSTTKPTNAASCACM